jgi:hypothetical protein
VSLGRLQKHLRIVGNFLRNYIGMVTFNLADACTIWNQGRKPHRALKISTNVNATKCIHICPKLTHFAKLCPKVKLWNTTKIQEFSVSQKYIFLIFHLICWNSIPFALVVCYFYLFIIIVFVIVFVFVIVIVIVFVFVFVFLLGWILIKTIS